MLRLRSLKRKPNNGAPSDEPRTVTGRHASRCQLVPRAAEDLTASEIRVLERLAAGLTGPEIASELGVSVSTVSTHVRHVREKLGVRTQAGAVAVALTNALIEGPAVIVHQKSGSAGSDKLA